MVPISPLALGGGGFPAYVLDEIFEASHKLKG